MVRFNAGDVGGLAELYAEDVVNDQVVFSQPLCGCQKVREMFELEFSRATMTCIDETIYERDGTALLQWRDPNGLRGCGFFQICNDRFVHPKGYFDQLTFFRAQGLQVPDDYVDAEQ